MAHPYIPTLISAETRVAHVAANKDDPSRAHQDVGMRGWPGATRIEKMRYEEIAVRAKENERPLASYFFDGVRGAWFERDTGKDVLYFRFKSWKRQTAQAVFDIQLKVDNVIEKEGLLLWMHEEGKGEFHNTGWVKLSDIEWWKTDKGEEQG